MPVLKIACTLLVFRCTETYCGKRELDLGRSPNPWRCFYKISSTKSNVQLATQRRVQLGGEDLREASAKQSRSEARVERATPCHISKQIVQEDFQLQCEVIPTGEVSQPALRSDTPTPSLQCTCHCWHIGSDCSWTPHLESCIFVELTWSSNIFSRQHFQDLGDKDFFTFTEVKPGDRRHSRSGQGVCILVRSLLTWSSPFFSDVCWERWTGLPGVSAAKYLSVPAAWSYLMWMCGPAGVPPHGRHQEVHFSLNDVQSVFRPARHPGVVWSPCLQTIVLFQWNKQGKLWHWATGRSRTGRLGNPDWRCVAVTRQVRKSGQLRNSDNNGEGKKGSLKCLVFRTLSYLGPQICSRTTICQKEQDLHWSVIRALLRVKSAVTNVVCILASGLVP